MELLPELWSEDGGERMRHTEEEIINALQVLKEVCEEYNDCDGCPLGCLTENGGIDCNMLTRVGYPNGWDIDTEPKTWRALR